MGAEDRASKMPWHDRSFASEPEALGAAPPRFVRKLILRSSAPVRAAVFLASVLAFALAYYLAAKASIATALPPDGIVVIWLPNAIILATLISISARKWSVFLVATVVTEVFADVPSYPLWASVGYGLVNFSEAAVAAALLRRFIGEPLPLASVKQFFLFLLIGPTFACAVAAVFGAAVYNLGNPTIDYLLYWRVFWLGDAIGMLVVGALLLAWIKRPLHISRIAPRRFGEVVVVSLGLVSVSLWVFGWEHSVPRLYFGFPFLIWAAIRFGVTGASLAILSTVAIALGTALNGVGPFVEGVSDLAGAASLQGFMATVAVTALALAFSREEAQRFAASLTEEVRRQKATQAQLEEAQRELEVSNVGLERTVSDRTRELSRSLARNELLLKEVHHRVKNSLQIVSSLLTGHSREFSDPAVRATFSRMREQVHAIATVYDVIQSAGGGVQKADFTPILWALGEGLKTASGPRLHLKIKADEELPITADAALVLSLAVNELVTNSLQHTAAESIVTVVISCQRESNQLVLTVADDGPGFTSDVPVKTAGFGMGMIERMVASVEGQIRPLPSPRGALFEIIIPTAG